MSQPTIADILDAVHALSGKLETLTDRVATLETELAEVRADLSRDEVPEEVVIAISAAVAAFLGHRARLKHVRYRSGRDTWTQHGRAAVHRPVVRRGVR